MMSSSHAMANATFFACLNILPAATADLLLEAHGSCVRPLFQNRRGDALLDLEANLRRPRPVERLENDPTACGPRGVFRRLGSVLRNCRCYRQLRPLQRSERRRNRRNRRLLDTSFGSLQPRQHPPRRKREFRQKTALGKNRPSTVGAVRPDPWLLRPLLIPRLGIFRLRRLSSRRALPDPDPATLPVTESAHALLLKKDISCTTGLWTQ